MTVCVRTEEPLGLVEDLAGGTPKNHGARLAQGHARQTNHLVLADDALRREMFSKWGFVMR